METVEHVMSRMEKFNFNIVEGVTIVDVKLKRATLTHAAKFKNLLTEHIDNGEKRFVIDLSSVDFMDSTFLGVLVVNLKKVRKEGGDLRIVKREGDDKNPIWLMFQSTNMYKMFKFYEGIDEAYESYQDEN
jgi:anti-anti-sigma factor